MKSTANHLKVIWEIYRPFRRHLIVSFVGLAAAQILMSLYPYAYGKALNAVVYKQGFSSLVYACGVLLVLVIASGFVSQYREYHELKRLDYDLKRSMRSRTSAKMLSLSVGQYHSEHSGVKQRIVNEGENAVVGLFKLVTYDIVPVFYEVGFGAIGCLICDWQIGLIVSFTVALVYFVSKQVSLRYGPLIDAQDRADDKTTKLGREIVSNVELIKLNSKEAFAVAEQDRLLGQVSDGWKRIWIPLNNLLWFIAVFPRTMRVVVMLFAGIRAYNGDMSVGTALVIWRLSESCLGRVGTINYFQRQWMSLTPRIARYVEFLGLIPDIQDAPNALPVPRFAGKIEFRDISFRYPTKPLMSIGKDETEGDDDDSDETVERDFAVESVNFKLDSGKRYALVGVSGSGKSTIKHLLARSYDPTSGVVRIDENPLPHLKLGLFRARVGIVDQDIPLLDRSLRENLLFLLPDEMTVSDEDIWRACKMARIDAFAHRLENGLDTLIGERGVKLSGGERQRVAIARVILKDPDIFIFDEATSALDSVNEDAIVESIKAVSNGKTTLMIAHRFSTILSADEIIVMDKGKIVGQGTHEHLYRTCPAYAKLVGPQIRTVERLLLS